MDIMRNAQRIKNVLSGFCSFHEVEKSRDAEVSQDQYKDKKRPYVARKMCATQGLKFLSILGVSQAARFCPFVGLRGCVRFPKTFMS